MKNSSVMQHAFARVPTVSHPRSVFNRSCGYKATFDADYLIPIFVDEVLPGDSMKVSSTFLVRLLSAAVKPFMDNLWMDVFWFFVPNRLLWSNSKKFFGEQDNPADSISFTVPQITSPNVAGGGIPVGHLFDYFGLPTGPLSGGGATTGLTVNNLHGRAYNQIWNQWFRDQNLQNSVTVDVGNGPDTWANYNLLKRGKRYDYFTMALPSAQKGATQVTLPLGSAATVFTAGSALVSGAQNVMLLKETSSGAAPTNNILTTGNTGAGQFSTNSTAAGAVNQTLYPSNLYADLSTATAATINSLRSSISLQQFLEQDARGGTRYPELVKSHFGVENPDSRVQIPEILSTFRGSIKIHPVAQTSVSGGGGALGTLAAFGTAVQSGNGFTKSFTEHGVILCLMSVTADLTYSQGVDRMWNRRTRYDFGWPILANLGEQAILNREIYANLQDGGGAAQKDGTFGYVPKYEEYRFKNSKICGDLRSSAAGTLDVWHLSEEFSVQPTLGATFIQSNTPLDRVIAVPSEPHFILDAFHSVTHARCLPTFGVPGLRKL